MLALMSSFKKELFKQNSVGVTVVVEDIFIHWDGFGDPIGT